MKSNEEKYLEIEIFSHEEIQKREKFYVMILMRVKKIEKIINEVK
jgi:hypothetical protein